MAEFYMLARTFLLPRGADIVIKTTSTCLMVTTVSINAVNYKPTEYYAVPRKS